MAWYRTGTVAVTNGSTTVTGTGTAFVANVRIGEGIVLPDGRTYEIANVASDTVLTLGSVYLGSTASGQSFVVVPTQSLARDLAAGVAGLISDYGSVRDNAGTGQFGDGTASLPGVRFINDQDTGTWRPAANSLAWSVGGIEAARIDANRNVLIGRTSSDANASRVAISNLNDTEYSSGTLGLYSSNNTYAAVFFNALGTSGANAQTALLIRAASVSSRSISAGGTINTGGADYAEYMYKAEDCGLIPKGAVCGVDADSKLVTRFSQAVSFVVKSTDPAFVGGDVWSADIGQLPTPPRGFGTEDPGVVNPNYAAELAAYLSAKIAFDAALEEVRQTVDRIAFSGQVPCRVTGDFAPGDYIIAAEGQDDTIVAVAVPEADITFAQYRRRIGKVWGVTEERTKTVNGAEMVIWPAGLAWIDVQHG